MADINLRALQMEEIKILFHCIRIFEKHSLQYYLIAGSCLGAVRHHGFIPWDDDIDLAMMRDDYDKLLKLIETEKLPEPYVFLTPLTDMEYGKGLIRFCNSQTTAIPALNAIFNYTQGIFIDIFPLDSIPDDKLKLKLYACSLKVTSKIMNITCRYYMGNRCFLTLAPANKFFFLLVWPLCAIGILNKERTFRLFTKAASYYNGKNQKRICLSTFKLLEKYINNREDYDVKIERIPFENTTLPVPVTYDRILKNHFGENYMTPIHENTYHGVTLYSTKIPYKIFKKMYKKELLDIWENRESINNRNRL